MAGPIEHEVITPYNEPPEPIMEPPAPIFEASGYDSIRDILRAHGAVGGLDGQHFSEYDRRNTHVVGRRRQWSF